MAPNEAIALMRSRRSEGVLANLAFERWLKAYRLRAQTPPFYVAPLDGGKVGFDLIQSGTERPVGELVRLEGAASLDPVHGEV
jgi:hypothetical protein